MRLEEKIIRKLATKYMKDPRVIREIVYHPFLFTKRVMEDLVDDRPTRIRWFGAFVQKTIKNKKYVMGRKREILLENIDEVFEAVISTTRHSEELESKDELISWLNLSEEDGGPLIIEDIWGIWKEHTK